MAPLATIGTVLLLVGAIVSTVGAAIASFVGFTAGQPFIMVVAGLLAIGAVLGFMAWRRAAAGQVGSAFGLGIASAVLPPIQALQLVGAILVKLADTDRGGAKAASPQSP